MTHNKQKQIKAIKNCLHSIGWKYVKVNHLHTNKYSNTIKTYEILFDTEKRDNYIFNYVIVVNSCGLSSCDSKQTVYLSILNALNKALKEAK